MKFNRKQRTERSKTLNLRGNLNKKNPQKLHSFFYKIAGHRSILQHSGPSTIMFIIIISFIPTAYDSFIELLSVQKTLHSHTLIICYIHIKDHFLGMTEDGWFPGFVWCRCLDQTKPACSKSSPVLEVLPIQWRQCPPLYYVPCEMMDCDRPMDS